MALAVLSRPRLFGAVLGSSAASIMTKDGIGPTHRDIPYGGHPRQTINLWKAESDGPTPVYVHIHGGGWVMGSKFSKWNPKLYLDRGISVASIGYRYTTDLPMPAPLLDAARAVQFIRSKSGEWGLDKARFAFGGPSAGGATALWLATRDDLADPRSADPVARESTKPCCVVAINCQPLMDPPTNCELIQMPMRPYPPLVSFFGYRDFDTMMRRMEEDRPRYRECSAQPHADKGDPPMYLVATRPMAIPPANIGDAIHHPIFMVRFKEELDRIGVESHLRTARSQPPISPDEFLFEKLLAPEARP